MLDILNNAVVNMDMQISLQYTNVLVSFKYIPSSGIGDYKVVLFILFYFLRNLQTAFHVCSNLHSCQQHTSIPSTSTSLTLFSSAFLIVAILTGVR